MHACEKQTFDTQIHLQATRVCKFNPVTQYYDFLVYRKLELRLLIPCHQTVPQCPHNSMSISSKHIPQDMLQYCLHSRNFVTLVQKFLHLTLHRHSLYFSTSYYVLKNIMTLPGNVVHMFTIISHVNLHKNNYNGFFFHDAIKKGNLFYYRLQFYF
jgi:hypothetical protein